MNRINLWGNSKKSVSGRKNEFFTSIRIVAQDYEPGEGSLSLGVDDDWLHKRIHIGTSLIYLGCNGAI